MWSFRVCYFAGVIWRTGVVLPYTSSKARREALVTTGPGTVTLMWRSFACMPVSAVCGSHSVAVWHTLPPPMACCLPTYSPSHLPPNTRLPSSPLEDYNADVERAKSGQCLVVTYWYRTKKIVSISHDSIFWVRQFEVANNEKHNAECFEQLKEAGMSNSTFKSMKKHLDDAVLMASVSLVNDVVRWNDGLSNMAMGCLGMSTSLCLVGIPCLVRFLLGSDRRTNIAKVCVVARHYKKKLDMTEMEKVMRGRWSINICMDTPVHTDGPPPEDEDEIPSYRSGLKETRLIGWALYEFDSDMLGINLKSNANTFTGASAGVSMDKAQKDEMEIEMETQAKVSTPAVPPPIATSVSSDSNSNSTFTARPQAPETAERKETKKCPKCGVSVDTGFAFCGGCGHKFGEQSNESTVFNYA